LVQQINGDYKDFTTDNLGNIYLITAANSIKKINEKGDSIAGYNDIKRYGSISSIDATNPFKVLVYYQDFATVIVLDRQLNTRNTIDFRKQNIFQVRAIATSYDNNIWLFDELDSKIKKLNDNGELLLESNDFRRIFDSVPSPSQMFDRDGQLYLYDKKKGLLVFDYYGGKKNNLQLLNYADLQVLDKNTLTARDERYLVLYKPSTFQLSTFKVLPNPENFSKIIFNGNNIYCLLKEGWMEVYKVMQ
jgi:hypothetical protein